MECDARQAVDCVLSEDQVAVLQDVFSDNEDGLEEKEFTNIMLEMFPGGYSKTDFQILFMRIDTQSIGRIHWHDVESFLLFNRARQSDTHLNRESANEMTEYSARNTKWETHQQTISQIVCHPRLPKYYTAGEDGVVKMWNGTTLSLEATVHSGNANTWITSMLVVPTTPELLIVSTIDRCISLYDATTGDMVRVYRGRKQKGKKIWKREVLYRDPPPKSQLTSAGFENLQSTHQYSSTLMSHLRSKQLIDVIALEHLNKVPTALGMILSVLMILARCG